MIHDALAAVATDVDVKEVVMPATTIASLSIGEDLCGGCLRAHTDFYPEQASKYGPGLIWLLELGRSTVPMSMPSCGNLRPV